MGEILGIGCTHWPSMVRPDEAKPWPLLRTIKRDPAVVPERLKNPANWPEAAQVEFGADEGITSHKEHRRRLVEAFRRMKDEIDAFNPDFILIFGDDQYENFQEDIIPPFCVLAYDQVDCRPFTLPMYKGKGDNVWGEPEDRVIKVRGHRAAGKYLTKGLMEEGLDMAYAYKPLHEAESGLGHAFSNTWIFLDYDRKGFDYPMIPLSVNCYGSSVIRNHGTDMRDMSKEPDPPSPSPKRCFELGRATARVLRDSPWRSVIIASSSWSHGFLTEKNHFMWPDIEADRLRFEQLRDGKQEMWKDITLAQIEESGHQELLNWVCLAGAMTELGQKVEILDYLETHVFNSNKCMALFRP